MMTMATSGEINITDVFSWRNHLLGFKVLAKCEMTNLTTLRSQWMSGRSFLKTRALALCSPKIFLSKASTPGKITHQEKTFR